MDHDQTPPEPHPGLAAIAGRWHATGTVLDEPPVSITGTDTYTVLPGGHFLLHEVDVTVGGQSVETIEMIGEREPGGAAMLARSYDSSGWVTVMRLQIDDDGVWRFSGGSDMAPPVHDTGKTAKEAAVRSTLRIAPDRSEMAALWERTEDGRNWLPWMDMHFTREDPR